MIVPTKNYISEENHTEKLKQLKLALEQSRSIVNKLNKENNNLKRIIEKVSVSMGTDQKKK